LGSVHSGEGAPNILFVLFDDTGLAAWSPFGGRINMPTLQKLADYGLMDSQWHTTALCSPTRSTLLTGRNHHLNGMAAITEATIGFPGANGRIPDQCATLGHIRQHGGWSTFWLGKNHNVFEGDIAAGASKKEWPLQKGFDRYYGFIGGETNQRIRISSRTIATWIRPPHRRSPGTCGSAPAPTTLRIIARRTSPEILRFAAREGLTRE
jgi:arylsulfatase A-like enzyme